LYDRKHWRSTTNCNNRHRNNLSTRTTRSPLEIGLAHKYQIPLRSHHDEQLSCTGSNHQCLHCNLSMHSDRTFRHSPDTFVESQAERLRPAAAWCR